MRGAGFPVVDFGIVTIRRGESGQGKTQCQNSLPGFSFAGFCGSISLYYFYPPLAQLVRATSLYLVGPWFESKRAD